MKISVVPQAQATLGGTLFELPEEYDPTIPLGVDRSFYHYLKEVTEAKGCSIGTIDQIPIADADILVFIGLREGFDHYYKALNEDERPYLVYLAREPPVYTPQHAQKTLTKLCSHFDLVLTWMDELSDVPSVRTFNWPVSPRQLSIDHQDNEPRFEDRKLLTNVSSRTASNHPEELYSDRERIINYYDEQHPNEFTLYGRNWSPEITPTEICRGLWQNPNLDVYKGEVESKSDVYVKHKFALSFENMTGLNGWISEKIFDVFAAGRVPVYWGASNINDYLPKDTFVDYREFGHPEELHSFLSAMTESEYNEYLEATEEYLSRGAVEFRADIVAENVFENILELKASPPKSIQRTEFMGKLEREYNREDVTFAKTASTSVEALIDPPENLSRIEIGTKVLRAGYNHYRK